MVSVVAILDFWSELSAIFDQQVPQILPTKFQVIWKFSSGGSKQIFKLAAIVAIFDFLLEQHTSIVKKIKLSLFAS